MLLEIMTLCSIIAVSPFYDCSEEWEIRIYSIPPMIQCNDHDEFFTTMACTNQDRKIIHMVHMPEHRDEFGQTILEHEIRHLKCGCNYHS